MKLHWQIYREGPIDNLVAGTSLNGRAFKTQQLWRNAVIDKIKSLVQRSMTTIQTNQRISHLENCLQLDPSSARPTGIWQLSRRLAASIDWVKSLRSYPRINCFSESGYVRWYGYAPVTREMIFLDSKEEAKQWLEIQKLGLP